MVDVKYQVIEHDGGYAYKVGDVFSETFPTHEQALDAAIQAADRQQHTGQTAAIQYQDAQGAWHEELAKGDDRPETEIEDDVPEESSNDAPEHNGSASVIGTTIVRQHRH
jgi:hypothetical protein